MTLRDDIWDEAIEVINEQGVFMISDLDFTESQRHTVRRVLRDMEEKRWLTRKKPQAKKWVAGEKAKAQLNLSAEAMAQAELVE